jgi:membrane-bound ClpP family serine protease
MKNFAFDRMNFILLAIGMAAVVLGFILMSGSGSTEDQFNPEIFSSLRIRVAPIICFAGFAFMVYGIMHKPKND